MKKLCISIVILSGLITIMASSAAAATKATFPDSKTLQPMPENVYPNISGNVNSTVDAPLEMQNQENNQLASENSTAENTREDAIVSSFSIWWILFPLLIIGFIFGYIKLKKKEYII